ncbi:hypothetical protein GUITHDRAFT_145221 [Guillardia theta CCMP2712]|uniref:RWP-RK domain-containing protein n=1 Tax=Guillardia theta (strain CCMP2712) TaxID=905079 RepID=L1ILI5_GUITC|nr:hypothetical protein GUITHDRAFT_145221 [Guillardia theta CCMP2712]EKX37111.1 hypothetical protein GUITHDRAFT_145221 [Guillardia theta CCMP2712]|eukprot:XP_005824091.1 hypothetical protein GUITHDRAFT_145221 [Guillardia theta CCMP2712]
MLAPKVAHVFPRRGQGPAQRNRKPLTFDINKISGLFHMRQTDAADFLGISLTTLKTVCKQLGVTRWPHARSKQDANQPYTVGYVWNSGSDMELYKELCPRAFGSGTPPTLTDSPLRTDQHQAAQGVRGDRGGVESGGANEEDEAVDEVVIDGVVIRVRVNEEELAWEDDEEELLAMHTEQPAEQGGEPSAGSAGGAWSRRLPAISTSRRHEASNEPVKRREAQAQSATGEGKRGGAWRQHEEMYKEVIEHLEGRSLKDTYWRGAPPRLVGFNSDAILPVSPTLQYQILQQLIMLDSFRMYVQKLSIFLIPVLL